MCLRKHPALQPTVRKFRKDRLPPMIIVTCAHIDTQLQVCLISGVDAPSASKALPLSSSPTWNRSWMMPPTAQGPRDMSSRNGATSSTKWLMATAPSRTGAGRKCSHHASGLGTGCRTSLGGEWGRGQSGGGRNHGGDSKGQCCVMTYRGDATPHITPHLRFVEGLHAREISPALVSTDLDQSSPQHDLQVVPHVQPVQCHSRKSSCAVQSGCRTCSAHGPSQRP